MAIDHVDTGKFVVHYATDIGEFAFRVTTRGSAEWWAAFLRERWGDRAWVTAVGENEARASQLSLLDDVQSGPLSMAKAEHPRRRWARKATG